LLLSTTPTPSNYATKTPTDELIQSLSDYRYDRGMFRAMLVRLDGFQHSAEQYAYIESFLIHTRNLIAFLFDDPPASPKAMSANDAFAVEYFAVPAEWMRERGDYSDFLKAQRKRIHQRLAHITKARHRRAPFEVQWNVRSIDHALSPAIDSFDRLVADLEQWFPKS
jgi:hypothetical protein